MGRSACGVPFDMTGWLSDKAGPADGLAAGLLAIMAAAKPSQNGAVNFFQADLTCAKIHLTARRAVKGWIEVAR